MGEWGKWELCTHTCGGGIQIRARSIHGGMHGSCGRTLETRDCASQPCTTAVDSDSSSVDCVMAQWEAWEPCSHLCGGGTKNRTRGILTGAALGGRECGITMQTAQCETQDCLEDDLAKDMDCVMGGWNEWGLCMDNCTQSRHRVMIKPQLFGGRACENGAETRSCVGDKLCGCSLTEWTLWGVCTETCGHGAQTRERAVISRPEGECR